MADVIILKACRGFPSCYREKFLWVWGIVATFAVIKIIGDMKKFYAIFLSATLLLSSCGTYTGAGAYTGTSIGGMLGSAIGGISDGPRGSDIGTIVGMAGGAIIGGIIGNAKDKEKERDYEQYERDRADRVAARAQRGNDGVYSHSSGEGDYNSGFDANNGGDDRLYDFTSPDYTGDYSAQHPQTMYPSEVRADHFANGLHYSPAIAVRNARFVDDNEDGRLQRGEISKIIFEIVNTGSKVLYDIQPTVVEATGNRHIAISPGLHVEQLAPGKAIRYTALVKAGNRLKAGTAKFCVSVIQGGETVSKVTEFNIPTRK